MRITITATLMGLFVFMASAGIPVATGGGAMEQVIVVFNDDVADPAAAASEVVATHGGQVGFVYRHALKGFSASLPAQALAALARNSQVAYIESNDPVSIDVQTVPTGIQRIFADTNVNLDIDDTDDFRVDVDVAVIDTGVDFEHPTST